MGLLSIIFRKEAIFRWGLHTSLAALGLLTVFGILRWGSSDHPPFVTLFESMTMSIWFLLLMFLIMRLTYKRLSVILLPLSFFSFLLIGWASSMESAASPLSAALQNTWLFIHASFATSGAAAFLVAASFGVIYLLGEPRLATMEKVAARIPTYESLPRSILNFLIFGLILWGVMIVSGSIWANAAWGRYWAWDPIELWSLISWLLYALVLHARLAFKLSKRLFCWLTIAAAVTVVFALWGVGYVYETIHTYG
jgi:cytochrome c-type biogenesis protein CcsB